MALVKMTHRPWTFEVKTNNPDGWMDSIPVSPRVIVADHRTYDLEIRHGGEMVLRLKGATEMEMWAEGVEELKAALLRANGEGELDSAAPSNPNDVQHPHGYRRGAAAICPDGQRCERDVEWGHPCPRDVGGGFMCDRMPPVAGWEA